MNIYYVQSIKNHSLQHSIFKWNININGFSFAFCKIQTIIFNLIPFSLKYQIRKNVFRDFYQDSNTTKFIDWVVFVKKRVFLDFKPYIWYFLLHFFLKSIELSNTMYLVKKNVFTIIVLEILSIKLFKQTQLFLHLQSANPYWVLHKSI